MTRIGRRLLVGAVAGLAALVVLATVASAKDEEPPDLEIAVLTDGRCGPFADSLPAVVTASNVAPGETVGDVTVCVRNRGEDGRFLALRAVELVDLDAACTGDEALVDASCGGGAQGELSDALVQQVGVGGCHRNPPTKPPWDRSLSDLSTNPLLLAQRLDEDRLVCVRLVLRYEPDAAAAVAAQSDRATWRYSFTLIGDETD